MSKELWGNIDSYFEGSFVKEPDCLKAAMKAAKEAKLLDISISPAQGKFLALLVQLSAAKYILEVGTLGGYSTLWMAQAMPEDGRLVTLENNPVCAGVARANFAHAGFAEQVELRYGDAMDSFKALVGEKGEPFDFIFIDANKPDYPEYLKWSLRLSRPGTLLVVDNVVRDGGIADNSSQDPAIKGIQKFHEMVGNDERLDATALQTVGSKGYDGLSLIRVV